MRTIDLLLADNTPWCLELRWTHPEIAARMAPEQFQRPSVNDWLAANIPFARAEVWLNARSASDMGADSIFGVPSGMPLLVRHSCGWTANRPVTSVDHAFHAGHRISVSI